MNPVNGELLGWDVAPAAMDPKLGVDPGARDPNAGRARSPPPPATEANDGSAPGVDPKE